MTHLRSYHVLRARLGGKLTAPGDMHPLEDTEGRPTFPQGDVFFPGASSGVRTSDANHKGCHLGDGIGRTYGVDPSVKVMALDRVASAERAEVGG